jgi:hypothetical protein
VPQPRDYGKYCLLGCDGMWSGRKFTDVSEEDTASIFREGVRDARQGASRALRMLTWTRPVIVEALDEDGALIHRVCRSSDLVRVLLQRSYQLPVVRGRRVACRGTCKTSHVTYRLSTAQRS